MTDHGKCTTCGRDMHPASRYGGMCWECHDAEGKRKDAEIRVLRDGLKRALESLAHSHRLLPQNCANSLADDHLCRCSGDEAGADIIRRIFDETP